MGNTYYIDTIDEVVGTVNIKNKKINVYNWFYKNIIFEEKKITFNNPGRSLFNIYVPEMAWLVKIEIDRVKLEEINYEKDTSFDYYLDKYSYLPDFIGTKIAKRQAKWKWVSSNKCEKYDAKTKENINFISKEEWENKQKEDDKPKF